MSQADVREGGRWTPAQRLKNDVLLGLVRLALAATGLASPRLLAYGGRLLGRTLHRLAPGLRRRAEANALRALGSAEVVPRAFEELGGLLGEAIALLDPRTPHVPLPFAPGAAACLEAALAEGRGVVFASAHLGPWERVAATLTGAGYPLTVVARAPYDPRLATVYDRLRARRGVRVVYREAAGAGVALVRVLRQNGVLGIPMDLASRVASVEVPFLGVPARTAVGPARLALRTGAAVLVGTVTSHAGDLAISFDRVEVCDDERVLTARINEALSRRIRALPHLWPWMHDRFRSAGTDVCS